MTDVPHSLEAEASVLGAVMLNPDRASEITDLKAQHFYRTAHRTLFDTIVTLDAEGTDTDVVSVIDRLEADGRLDELGGSGKVQDLVHLAPVSASLDSWKNILRRTARQRQIMDAAAQLHRDATDDPDQALARFDQALSDRDMSEGWQVYGYDELEQIPEPRWLLAGMVQHGLAMIYGPYGTAKTFTALDWSFTVAAGGRWFGRRTWTCPVVYVAAEGAEGIAARRDAWAAEHDVDPSGRWTLVGNPVNLLDRSQVMRLCRLLDDRDAGMVVIDTLDRCTPGGSDSEPEDMSRVIGHLDMVRDRTDCASLLVHHTGWDESRERGWTGMGGALDSKWRCEADGDMFRLVNDKQKNGPEDDDWRLAMVESEQSVVLDLASSHGDPRSQLVEALLDGRLSMSDMDRIAGGDHGLVENLIDAGVAVEVNADRGLYRHRREASPDPVSAF